MEPRQGVDWTRRYPAAFPLERPGGTSSLAPEEAESVLCGGAAHHGSPAFQGRDNNNKRLFRRATFDARSSAILQEIIHASLRDAVLLVASFPGVKDRRLRSDLAPRGAAVAICRRAPEDETGVARADL